LINKSTFSISEDISSTIVEIKKKADIRLSELDLMNILWQSGKASAPEVHEKIK
jgi:hypothetical protein